MRPCPWEPGLTESLSQAKQDADHLLQEKVDIEKEKKRAEEEAIEKERLRDAKCKRIGNYVHESVPVNDNEVREINYRHSRSHSRRPGL